MRKRRTPAAARFVRRLRFVLPGHGPWGGRHQAIAPRAGPAAVTPLIAARPLDVDESAATVPVPSLAVPKGDRTTRHSDYVLAVWEQHRASLYGFAVRVTRNPTVAEDLVQDAFLRLLREVQRSGPPNDPRSWLMRVLANLGVSRARRASVAERLGPRLVNRETGESPEMRIIRKEHGAVLDAALARLGRDERVVLLLAASGFSGREIASAIGRSEGATRTLLCRSRVKVHRLLGEDDG